MKRIVFYLVCILLLSSCASKLKLVDQSSFPKWLQERPNSSIYFIGIGSAKKNGTPDSYMKLAREQALADMSQSISVNISSTTTNTILEGNDGLHEIYRQDVKAQTNEIFDGVEMIDQFDDGENYHAYYQIDKASFFKFKEERKQKALKKALSYYKQAKTQEKHGQIARALGLYVEVVNSIVYYLNESTKINDNGVDVNLAYEARNSFDRLVMGLSLTPSQANIVVKRGDKITDEQLTFLVEYVSDAVADIPVVFSYSGAYLKRTNVVSNNNGEASTQIQSVTSKRANERVEAVLNINSIVRNSSNDLFIRKLFASRALKKQSVDISILAPSVRIISQRKYSKYIDILESSLTNSGIEVNGGDDYSLSFSMDKQEKKLSYARRITYSLNITVKSIDDSMKQKIFKYRFSGEGANSGIAKTKALEKLERALQRRVPSELSRFILR